MARQVQKHKENNKMRKNSTAFTDEEFDRAMKKVLQEDKDLLERLAKI